MILDVEFVDRTRSRFDRSHVPSLPLTSATLDLVVFGMISSLFGPLLVTLAHRFHLSLPAAGVVLSVYFVGAFFGVPIGWLSMRRFTGAAVLSGTLLITALGACGAALSTHWAMFLASVFFLGLGFGGVDFSLISLLVRTRTSGRGRRLSVTNAGYGLGAVIGPLLLVVVRPTTFACSTSRSRSRSSYSPWATGDSSHHRLRLNIAAASSW